LTPKVSTLILTHIPMYIGHVHRPSVDFRRLFNGKVHQNVFVGLALPGAAEELTV